MDNSSSRGPSAKPYRAVVAANPPSLRGCWRRAGPQCATGWTDTYLSQAWDNFSRAQSKPSAASHSDHQQLLLCSPSPRPRPLSTPQNPTDRLICKAPIFPSCVTKSLLSHFFFFVHFACLLHDRLSTRYRDEHRKKKCLSSVSPPGAPRPSSVPPPSGLLPPSDLWLSLVLPSARRRACEASTMRSLSRSSAPGETRPCPSRRRKGDQKLQTRTSWPQPDGHHPTLAASWVKSGFWQGSMADESFPNADTRPSSTMCRMSLSSR